MECGVAPRDSFLDKNTGEYNLTFPPPSGGGKGIQLREENSRKKRKKKKKKRKKKRKGKRGEKRERKEKEKGEKRRKNCIKRKRNIIILLY